MTDALIAVLILGLANGALGQIVTYAGVFAWLREWMEQRPPPFGDYLGQLFDCPLCFGTWTALLISSAAVMRATDWAGVNGALAVLAGAGAINMVGIIAGAAWRLLIEIEERE